MMTSVVPDATRGNRDRAQPQTAHTSQPQKQIQATAEQIRLAQVIYDKNDADSEGKVKQLIEVTGRNQDECMVALHDCNGDVNRAINYLLEEVPAKDSWETVGKKKSVGKEAVTATETRERRTDREGRGRGGPNRRGRGASRGQEGRSEENGFDSAPGERGERGRRGRGRGPGGRGRGRGDVGNRFSQGMGTFYPAEYTVTAEPGDSANNTTDGSWRNNLEDWAAEDWNEDLSETKVFTATFAFASQNHVTPGQGGDLSSVLPKGSEDDSELVGLEPMSLEPLTQSLVFTNSQQHAAHTHTHSYASAAANSYASAAASTYAHAALGLGSRPPQPDLQKAEPVSAPRISPLLSQAPVTQRNGSPVRERTSPSPPVAVALNEPKVETPVTVSQMDLKAQPDPSPVLSQLPQHQNYTLQTDLPVQGRNPSPPMPPRETPSPVLKPLVETNPPIMAEPHQPKHVRPQRRRQPPPSKIPLSAVEMPGSADVSGLNVQFGALDFASESTVENSNLSEPVSQEPAPPVTQSQSSLYSKPGTVSETITSLLPAISASTVELRYPSPSVGLPTATAPTASPPPRVEPPSLRKETTTTSSTPLTNGYSDVRPSAAKDAAPTSTPQSMSTSLPSDNSMTSSSLPSSSSSAPAPTPSTALPSLSSTHVSSGTTLGSAAPVSSAMNSHVASDVSSFSSTALNSNGLINSTPSLSTNGPSAPSTARSAPMQTTTATSSKAPPNLPQGVPPLLANQYIMGPGGLLPAYPQIYGYDELMMQSRLPLDYYGIPAFPGTTTLAARDGGLANNPYSGDAAKFARGEAPSPAPPTSLSSVTSSQSEPGSVPTQSQAPQNPGHSFLNPPLPPGYGYTSLPYYAGMPGVPSAFQYAPTVFVPTASAKQHAQYQHQAGYGGHAYASGFDDLSQAHAGGDYGKGAYGGSAQSQAKPGNNTGKAPGLSGSASSDLSGTVYSKTQSFEKQGFPTATPATFSLPSALGGTGPLNPGGAPGYAHAPFLHILPHHQQPPSQLLHHHMAQDTQVQRNQSSSMQKSQGKSSYSSSPYWAN